MQKINIKTSLIEPNIKDAQLDLETKGTINENCIIYKDIDVKVTVKCQPNLLTLIRENDTYKLIMLFEPNKNSDGIYTLKGEHATLSIRIKTTNLIIDDHKIEVDYQIKHDNKSINYFKYILEYEAIE